MISGDTIFTKEEGEKLALLLSTFINEISGPIGHVEVRALRDLRLNARELLAKLEKKN